MEVSATRKQWLTLSMDPRMAEQMGHFMLTVGKPVTYSGSCIMALRTHVLISLLLTLIHNISSTSQWYCS